MKYTLLSCIDSKIINSTTFYGRFELGPWSSGQALTIANTLRRGLLSEIPGTAITFVKIIGTSHEYDTIPGMRECILDVLLNLKQIILKSEFKVFSPQIGFLNVKGPGIIKAGDLKLPFFIKSVDPNQYIATLNHKGKLNIKFLIHSGKKYLNHTPSSKNYFNWVNLLEKKKPINLIESNNKFLLNKYKNWKKQRELNKKNFLFNSIIFNNLFKNKKNYKLINNLFLYNKNKLIPFDNLIYINNKIKQNKEKINKSGYFPIDAIFSPIKKVNYTIEIKNSITKRETIFLEIWTNGTIDPRSAIHNTVKILIKLFLPLQKLKINFFNNYKTKLYFNKFNYLYFNKKIIKLTKIYFYKNKFYYFNNMNKLLNKKFNKFKNVNFIFLKHYKTDNLFYKNYYNLILNNKYIKENKFNLIFFKKVNIINKYLKNYKKQTIFKDKNTNIKKNILELDVLNLELNTRIYFILKKININKIKDLVVFKSNYFYIFNTKILNLKILTKYDLFELKQNLKKYNIFIINF